MKYPSRLYLTAIFVFLPIAAQEMYNIKTFDREEFIGRLMFPDSNYSGILVIDVPGTGPSTYSMDRRLPGFPPFAYHDIVGNELNSLGAAYFSFNTRYTSIDTTNPPFYEHVEKEKFVKYSPMMKVQDVESIVLLLSSEKRFSHSKIYLLGTSEGASISLLVAERKNVRLDGLFLIGTPPVNGFESAVWQLSGGSTMTNFRAWFDQNEDGKIQWGEYVYGSERIHKSIGNIPFKRFDANGDSLLTEEDFYAYLERRRSDVLESIERRDDEWIWKNYFHVGSQWFEDHRKLGSNSERILKLAIPIYIFHGIQDANCPVEQIWKLHEVIKRKNLDNIHVYTFDDHDHSLNFILWVVKKKPTQGWQSIIHQITKKQ